MEGRSPQHREPVYAPVHTPPKIAIDACVTARIAQLIIYMPQTLLAISVGIIDPGTTYELGLLAEHDHWRHAYAVFVASITAFFADADPSAREYVQRLTWSISTCATRSC